VTMIINLTSHDIRLRDPDTGTARVFQPSGLLARVVSRRAQPVSLPGLADLPTVRQLDGVTTGLPPLTSGVAYIVSGRVLHANPERPDLLAPTTDATAIRSIDRQITAVISFDVNEQMAEQYPLSLKARR